MSRQLAFWQNQPASQPETMPIWHLISAFRRGVGCYVGGDWQVIDVSVQPIDQRWATSQQCNDLTSPRFAASQFTPLGFLFTCVGRDPQSVRHHKPSKLSLIVRNPSAKLPKLAVKFNPLALELDIYSLAHRLCKMWIFYEPRRVTLGDTWHFVEE